MSEALHIVVTAENRVRLLELIEQLRATAVMVLEAAPPAADPAPAPPPPPQPSDADFPFNDRGAFYDFLRGNRLLGPTISQSEFDGCEAILAACAAASWPLAFTAYALATAYLETAHTMQPIHEYGGPAYFKRMYDIEGQRPVKARELGNLQPGDGARFHGRGYVQLTGRSNYRRAGQALGEDLEKEPDLAVRPDIAAAIMIRGMAEGWFTGRKLGDFLPVSGPATRARFEPARQIINGRDRAGDIAGYAVDFQQALLAGGWRFGA
jgi:putative chitinase